MKKYLLVIAFLMWSQPAVAVTAKSPEQKYELKVRSASVDSRWNSVLNAYTGGSYSASLVNQLWPNAPKGKKRKTILGAAIHHHVPFRLLLGVWGAESGFGKYACHFGLTGYFPSSGTSGSFWKDAHMSADIFDRLYRNRYGRRAL